MKVAFLTLGCKVNQFETETMKGLFLKNGHNIVEFNEKADVYLINTCSVTSLGEKKSRQMIRRAHRLNENGIVVVTGCYAQLAPKEVEKLEGVRLVIGTRERERLVELVEEVLQKEKIAHHITDIMKAKEFEDIPLFGTPKRTRAFLKIQEGCENFCTYCIIPYTRGPLRSRKLDSVKRETGKLVNAGFHEIVLTGIHLGAYGRDLEENTTLYDAAREVLAFPELKRLRLGSLESIELSKELFDLMEKDTRFARHLHLPLQGGSDEILRRMNRHYTKVEFFELIEKIRKRLPDIAISTDVIVGFPGETEEEFKESLEFVETMGFARLHVFPYSKREGTIAAKMEGQIPANIKHERVQKMQQLGEKMAKSYMEKFLAKTTEVLFETEKDGISLGLTGNYIHVYARSARLGEICKVKLISLYEDGIWGEIEK